ncbi:hypothetical protein F993_02233 [Acinetobacter proteolyticus]|uniref:Lipoprotein n=1 Tax=Acinetobacter proteolyticus TaxID=1776741 RepID=A0ABN0JDA1_9GAMM|nr:hypothetical protein [Acinetobacter proteolyticus]ENU23085.1 hypothetical protein F993_02233 [Acinetobacter proteolyticus]
MEKSILWFSLAFVILISQACTKHTLYFTPEIVGYIYDRRTKLPLANQTGEMGFNGQTSDKDAQVKLKADGHFTIPSVRKTYYFIKPNTRKHSYFPSEIFISFKGYEFRSFDYSSAYVEQVPEGKSNFNHYKKIDLGVIYLDPEK